MQSFWQSQKQKEMKDMFSNVGSQLKPENSHRPIGMVLTPDLTRKILWLWDTFFLCFILRSEEKKKISF